MNPRVDPARISDEYDGIFLACGYEQRSMQMLRLLEHVAAPNRVAFGYGDNEVLRFDENAIEVEAAGFNLLRVKDVDFATKFLEVVRMSIVEGRGAHFLIDISCFTRFRLACVIRALINCAGLGLKVDFFYGLAEFQEPSPDDSLAEHVGPASEFFSGWSGEYEKPPVVISGLGYEHMKALGTIDLIDPAATWLFFPVSPIDGYDKSVQRANSLLLRDTDESRIIRYDVIDAPSLFRDLFALVGALRSKYRCVLLPLGPKLFAFASLLAGAHFRDISVWRVSAGRYANPVDRLASPQWTLFSVSFAARGT